MKKAMLIGLFITLAAVTASQAAESWWPQFRGPNCSGVSESAKPPVEFGPANNEVWKVSVPPGASSPCVWGDWIFLTAFENGKLETLCYRRSDGKLNWKQETPQVELEEYNSTEGSPAASTVATDGQHVVSYFGSYGLICYDTKGRELWKHPLPMAHTAGGFGSGGSPLIANGLVFVNRDQVRNCSLLAVDLKTGKKAWEAVRPDVTQSFGTPITWKNGRTDELVMSGSLKLKAYDLKSGSEHWSLAGMPSFTCTTPVVGDGMLFFAGWAPGKEPGSMPSFDDLLQSSDKNHDGVITQDEATAAGWGSFFRGLDVNGDGKITREDLDLMKVQMSKGENVLVAVKPGGSGELAEQQVAWKQTTGLPYVSSPLYYRGRVYLVKDGGMVSSFDAKTGKAYYEKERLDAPGSYYASPVAADGRIYFTSLTGRLSVVEAGGDQPKVLKQANFGERIWATPALIGKTLYLRTASSLFAFGQ